MKKYFSKCGNLVSLKVFPKEVNNSLFSLLGLFIFQLVNAITILLIARKISTFEYGQLVSIKAFVSILVVIANYGIDSWFLANANFFENYHLIWKKLFIKKIFIHLIVFLIGFLISVYYFDNDAYPAEIFIFLGLSLVLDSFLQSIFTFNRVKGKFDLIFLIQIMYSVLLLILVWIIPFNSNTFILFCFVKAIISGISFGVGLLSVNKDIKLLGNNNNANKLNQKINNLTFYVADVSAVFYERIDIFLISILIGVNGNKIYGPAINIIFFSFFLPSAIYFVVIPVLSRAFKNSNYSKNNPFVKYSTIQLVTQILFGILMFIFIKFFSSQIVRILFGNSYIDSIMILETLAIIPLIKFTNFGLGAIITSSKNQNIRSKIMILAACINFFLNLLLIKKIGLEGAVFSYIISELFLMIWYSYFSLKILRNQQ